MIGSFMYLMNTRPDIFFAVNTLIQFHDKSKHIEIKYHYIKDMVQRGAVKLQYVVMEK